MSKFHAVSLIDLARTLVQHRELVWRLAKREFSARYSGSVLGVLWSFMTPVLQVLAFTFLFGVIFKVRWAGLEVSAPTNYIVLLFVGLIVHGLFSEAISRAPTLIVGQASYVKRIVFPLEILPAVNTLTVLGNAIIGLCIVVVLNLVLFQQLPWTAIYIPLVLLPFVLTVTGLVFFVSAAGVYLRDISHAIGTIVTLSLFLSPVLYPIASVPERYRPLFYMNPLTPVVEQARGVLLFGTSPDWVVLAAYMLVSLAVLALGFAFFQKSRNGFADVL
jgi:lipopolysaccharide transport system permease protein